MEFVLCHVSPYQTPERMRYSRRCAHVTLFPFVLNPAGILHFVVSGGSQTEFMLDCSVYSQIPPDSLYVNWYLSPVCCFWAAPELTEPASQVKVEIQAARHSHQGWKKERLTCSGSCGLCHFVWVGAVRAVSPCWQLLTGNYSQLY